MVKQHVGVVVGLRGHFRVFTTDNPKYYLFSTIGPDGCEGGLQFPVLKKDLKSRVKRALRNGCSYYSDERDAPK